MKQIIILLVVLLSSCSGYVEQQRQQISTLADSFEIKYKNKCIANIDIINRRRITFTFSNDSSRHRRIRHSKITIQQSQVTLANQ